MKLLLISILFFGGALIAHVSPSPELLAEAHAAGDNQSRKLKLLEKHPELIASVAIVIHVEIADVDRLEQQDWNFFKISFGRYCAALAARPFNEALVNARRTVLRHVDIDGIETHCNISIALADEEGTQEEGGVYCKISPSSVELCVIASVQESNEEGWNSFVARCITNLRKLRYLNRLTSSSEELFSLIEQARACANTPEETSTGA